MINFIYTKVTGIALYIVSLWEFHVVNHGKMPSCILPACSHSKEGTFSFRFMYLHISGYLQCGSKFVAVHELYTFCLGSFTLGKESVIYLYHGSSKLCIIKAL